MRNKVEKLDGRHLLSNQKKFSSSISVIDCRMKRIDWTTIFHSWNSRFRNRMTSLSLSINRNSCLLISFSLRASTFKHKIRTNYTFLNKSLTAKGVLLKLKKAQAQLQKITKVNHVNLKRFQLWLINLQSPSIRRVLFLRKWSQGIFWKCLTKSAGEKPSWS